MSIEVRRILVALDTSMSSRAALESAAGIARQLGAELLGVFVEDLALVQLAALPLARELRIASASARALDPAAMQRSLEAQASQARASLEQASRRFGLRASFRVARGDVVTELLAAAAEADLLALGLSGQMEIAGRRIGSTVRAVVAQARCSILIEHAHKRTGTAVALVYEGRRTDARVFERALALASARQAELAIVPVGDGDGDAMAELDQRLAERSPLAVAIRVEAPQRDARALRDCAARRGCGLVMIARDSALLAEEPDRLADLGCPLLLLA
jgi:nucleotide-binding universal stress UspA family protein